MTELSRFVSVAKTSVKSYFGISALVYRMRTDKKKALRTLLGLAALGVALAPFESMIFSVARDMLNVFSAFGLPEVVLALATLASQLMVMFSGVFYISSNFYFAKDLPNLLVLPLSKWQVMAAKFVVVLLGEYLSILPLMAPVLIAYWLVMRPGLVFLVVAVGVYALLPVIPLAVSGIVVVALVRLIPKSKGKDIMHVVAISLSVVVLLAVQYVTGVAQKGLGSNGMEALLGSGNVVNVLTARFPPAGWAAMALAYPGRWKGLSGLMGLFIVSVVIIFVMLAMAQLVFYQGIITGEDRTATNKSSRLRYIGTEKDMEIVPKSIIRALVMREFILVTRTPVFITTGLINIVIIPVAMLFPMLISGEFATVLTFLKSTHEIRPVIVMIAGMVAAYLTVMSGLPMTSISREGRLFAISKAIPVEPKRQVTAKVIFGISLGLITCIILSLVVGFILGLGLSAGLLVMVFGILALVPSVILGIIIDLLWPRLDWTEPQRAVKGNLTGLLLITCLLSGAGFLAYVLSRMRIAATMMFIIEAIALAVTGLVFYNILVKLANKKYYEIQVE